MAFLQRGYGHGSKQTEPKKQTNKQVKTKTKIQRDWEDLPE